MSKHANEDIIRFLNLAQTYSDANKGLRSRFMYKLQRGLTEGQRFGKRYNEDLQGQYEDLATDLALTEEVAGGKQALLLDAQGNLRMDAFNQKKLRKQRLEAKRKLDETKVEFPEHFVRREDLPLDLTVGQMVAFRGFLISDEDFEWLEEKSWAGATEDQPSTSDEENKGDG